MDDVRVPVTEPLTVEVHLEYRLDYSKFPGLREELRGLKKPQPALMFARKEDALRACQEQIFQALDTQDWTMLSDGESGEEDWQEEFMCYSERHLEADMDTTNTSSSSEEDAPVLEMLPPLSPLSDIDDCNSVTWSSCIPETSDDKYRYIPWNDYSMESSDEESCSFEESEELDVSRREKIPHHPARSTIAARMLIEDLMCNQGYRNEHRCGIRFIDTDGVQHTAF